MNAQQQVVTEDELTAEQRQDLELAQAQELTSIQSAVNKHLENRVLSLRVENGQLRREIGALLAQLAAKNDVPDETPSAEPTPDVPDSEVPDTE